MRPQRTKQLRNTILIITNGEQTEKNYFRNITSTFRTMYTIKVDYQNLQCDALVAYAAKQKDDSYNQIWCVFDIDDTFTEGHLLNALSMAKREKINIAYSNESFEVWLLYHFNTNVKPSLSRKTYEQELNKCLQANGRSAIYRKNDLELLKSEFIPQILVATENAKKVHQKLEAEHQKSNYGQKNYPIWEWKSSTTVYQLIDSLQLSDKNID